MADRERFPGRDTRVEPDDCRIRIVLEGQVPPTIAYQPAISAFIARITSQPSCSTFLSSSAIVIGELPFEINLSPLGGSVYGVS
jgi:hypothetical protein